MPCLFLKTLIRMGLHLARVYIAVVGSIPFQTLGCFSRMLSKLTLEMCVPSQAKVYERSMQ
jgi:hypothetical protein